MKTHFYLYQITNKVNGKIYVGVHKTKSLDDGYMGSGKVVQRAIMKHGAENFEKVILETFEDEKSMYAREKEVVTEEFLAREDVYNLRRGGTGGFDYINNNELNGFSSISLAREAAKISNSGKRKFTKEKLHSDLDKLKRFKELSSKSSGMLGKNHCEATINRMSESHKGTNNSQFGSMWITNDSVNKKIKNTDLIPEGWRKGRVTLQCG